MWGADGIQAGRVAGNTFNIGKGPPTSGGPQTWGIGLKVKYLSL